MQMPYTSKEVMPSTPNGSNNINVAAANNESDIENVDERIHARRTEILLDLQRQLEELMDRHDDLVREAFQLDKFVTLLDYDPKVAKQDASQVFLQFKESFDLITKSVEADANESPRKTRRALTEQRMSLLSALKSRSTGLSNSPSSQKDKGHVSDTNVPPKLFDSSEASTTLKLKHKFKRNDEKVKSKQIADSTPVAPKRIMQMRKAKTAPTSPAENALSPRGIKRKASSAFKDLDRGPDPNTEMIIPSPNSEARPADFRHAIKRVRLFQRPRPISYTHPSQAPSKARHGGSIRKFLESYATIENSDDMTVDAYTDTSTKEAELRARIRSLRKDGRLTLNVFDLPEGFLESSQINYQADVKHEDHHQDLLSSALHKSRAMLAESSFKKLAAKKLSKNVLAWHASREGNEEKMKKAEVLRIRTLAKLTAKEVEKQWKKAVFAIRERNRLILEAEEARLGRMHLDAILDQSGMILEAQQSDLTRIRSRSESINNDSGGESHDEESKNDIDTDIDTDTDTETEFVDVDASYLLGLDAAKIPHLENDRDSEGPSEWLSTDIPFGSRDTSQSLDKPYSRTASVDEVAVSSGEDLDDNVSVASTSTGLDPDKGTQISLDEDRTPTSDIDGNPKGDMITSVVDHPENEGKGLEHSLSAENLEASDDDSSETPDFPTFATPAKGDHNLEIITDGPTSSVFGKEQLIDGSSEFPLLNHENSGSSQDENAKPLPGNSLDTSVDVELPTQEDQDDKEAEIEDEDADIPPHLQDFAVAPVDWDPESKVNAPFLLRGVLRPYQQAGLEWLASLHTNKLNGILADEMGLGKTIQAISLLAHLACDRGIWGPHLIIVPTSVLLNWEMEFKKFLPGFKVLPYHGNTKRRKELRVGWNNKHGFNVCVTSYTLASRDAHIFKRKSWYYMILDEAHMIKNFKSQRWNILLMFRSFRRLLLTGTPLQNNLIELWALLQFLMSGTDFANVKEFGDWFSNPLEKAIEQGTVMDEETQERVRKLHTVLRPYLMRRLKADVEKELPSKYEHIVTCRLSKRQRFLYDEFMSRAATKESLASGLYHKVANVLMQLRKVCNHPDLFEVRPIVTSFAMPRPATADFEIKELLVRRRLLQSQDEQVNLDFLGMVFYQHQGSSMIQARSTSSLDASPHLLITELPGEPPPCNRRIIEGYKQHIAYQRRLAAFRQWTHIAYVNHLRCAASPIYGMETIAAIRRLYTPLKPAHEASTMSYLERSEIIPKLIKSYERRSHELIPIIDHFAFVTPAVVARDMATIALSGYEEQILRFQYSSPDIVENLHRISVKLQIAFPDVSLIQYDCGKLQELATLLRKRAAGGHRVLIFTQMTRVLDILEIFLNFHGYRYLRLDGATKIEDRQYITERFNNDSRIFAFIASSRSGGVGINLTGADTVIFYDSDFNPQMDRQCEDRAHRIGQIRDVHIYRFISEHTVEESMLRKANQKRSLDNIVIQQGGFDWHKLIIDDVAFGKALEEFEDREDALAARLAAREEAAREVEDDADFGAETEAEEVLPAENQIEKLQTNGEQVEEEENEEEKKEGTIAEYMLSFVNHDWEWFATWRL